MTQTSSGPSVVASGAYSPWVQHEGLIYVSGLTPRVDSKMLFPGRVGVDVSIDDARKAASAVASRILACLVEAAGSLDSIAKILVLNVYIASSSKFRDHSKVADFVSAALIEVLGERANGARTAIGVTSLPGNAPIEVATVAALRGSSS
jgi:enamine deaminase RidA (YjgF/YER057c/UK114 family)